MAIIFVFIGAILGATFNYLLRCSVDKGGSTKAFLLVELYIATVVVFLFSFLKGHNHTWNTPIASMGFVAGIFFGGMLWAIGRSVEKGPAGLTFAIVNSASVFPGVIMAVLFGTAFGFIFDKEHAIGSALVVIGLFWAGWDTHKLEKGMKWLFYSLLACCCHILFLSFMQWRVLHLKLNLPASEFLLDISADQAGTQWFLPMVFAGASFIQAVIYYYNEIRWPNPRECLLGMAGGLTSAGSIFFLLQAAEVAGPRENAILFPLSSLAVIILCNIWGQLLYKEKVNWWANGLCLAGIVVATANWQLVF